MDTQDEGLQHISQFPLLQGKSGLMVKRKDVIDYFYEKLEKKTRYPALAIKLQHLNFKDLMYLKSICDKAELEGRSEWGKVFWGSLKVK